MSVEAYRENPEISCTLEDIYRRVQDYSDGIRNTEEYQKALLEFDAGQLRCFPPGTLPTVDFYLRRGIASSIMAVELIAMIASPVRHEQLLKEFDEGIIPDHWIEQLVVQQQRDATQNDYGLSTLRLVRERDRNTILQKVSQGLDEQQEKGYELHADVVGRGHNFIITRYEEELIKCGLLSKVATLQS